jgi:hypothetical protein
VTIPQTIWHVESFDCVNRREKLFVRFSMVTALLMEAAKQ